MKTLPFEYIEDIPADLCLIGENIEETSEQGKIQFHDADYILIPNEAEIEVGETAVDQSFNICSVETQLSRFT